MQTFKSYLKDNPQTFIWSVAENGEGLSGAGLSVGKEAGVVAVPCILKNAHTQIIKDFFLQNSKNTNIILYP